VKREQGMSSLAMVLLLLILGSLMLSGLNQRQHTHYRRGGSESQALRNAASVQSALEWARVQRWLPLISVQCKEEREQGWRACIRLFNDNSLLLIAASGDQRLWRSGEVKEARVTFSRHGWSDFCPLAEAQLCQLP